MCSLVSSQLQMRGDSCLLELTMGNDYFLVTQHGVWNLSYPTRDQTQQWKQGTVTTAMQFPGMDCHAISRKYFLLPGGKFYGRHFTVSQKYSARPRLYLGKYV